MPLADHNPAKIERRPPGPPCSIGRLLEDLDEDDRAELRSWLANKNYRNNAIAAALRDAGHQASRFTVGWHRRGDCACE